MAGAYVALDRLRGEGVVAGIGIGVNEAEMCVRFAQAGSFDTMLLAGRYSLLEQPALKQFLPLARSRAEHAIRYCSLPVRCDSDCFINGRVQSCFEEEKLIQTKSQNIAKIGINRGNAQAADPEIEQR